MNRESPWTSTVPMSNSATAFGAPSTRIRGDGSTSSTRPESVYAIWLIPEDEPQPSLVVDRTGD
jgi:hypothetical protein